MEADGDYRAASTGQGAWVCQTVLCFLYVPTLDLNRAGLCPLWSSGALNRATDEASAPTRTEGRTEDHKHLARLCRAQVGRQYGLANAAGRPEALARGQDRAHSLPPPPPRPAPVRPPSARPAADPAPGHAHSRRTLSAKTSSSSARNASSGPAQSVPAAFRALPPCLELTHDSPL